MEGPILSDSNASRGLIKLRLNWRDICQRQRNAGVVGGGPCAVREHSIDPMVRALLDSRCIGR